MKTSMLSNAKYPDYFISVNKNRIKHYVQGQKIVAFLKSGNEFEMEFSNKTNFTWLAKISINGKEISSSGLVLCPGEHVYLDRYFDSPKKFKFETFEIDDVPETQKALEQNGEIVVQFFKEAIPQITITNTYIPPRRIHPWWWDTREYYSSDITYCATMDAGTKTRSVGTSMKSAGAAPMSVNCCQQLNDAAPKSIETGRVGEGNHSNQSFSTVYKNWEVLPSLIRTIQILPASRKDVTSQEISSVRRYCGECGVKVNPKDNYCYKCGEKL